MSSTHRQTHLSHVQIEALRRELEEQLAWRRSQLQSLHASAGDSKGADGTWQELTASIVAADRAIADITHALERLDAGTYGRCVECETEIPFERLKIRPLARFCIRCQRRHEAA
ncbi:TraR/DksA family transcriptional regulator [Thermoactinospora rubra]|uniref:TraR/DksA family transcriptional regulator n=1 Tax=Thermoactinospora rubra TaxID=1088767 RepID=UPI000A10C4BF|nr:TraR/DksA C4-type zinc finger protein [Thermoactinospora rubra]